MMADIMPPLCIASADLHRLRPIAMRAVEDDHPVGRFLVAELARARACESEDTRRCARLDEWVTFRADRDAPRQSRLLVLPEAFRSNDMHLSVLSPVGAALLGLPVGARMPYRGIDGTPYVAVLESLDPPPGVVSLNRWRAGLGRGGAAPNPTNPDGPTAA